jgi:hypothetical protein
MLYLLHDRGRAADLEGKARRALKEYLAGKYRDDTQGQEAHTFACDLEIVLSVC